jgi:outer membrane lipoprotein SlyB
LRKVDARSIEECSMVRRYAAALGLLAFATILLRGIAAGGAWNSTLGQALAGLVIFTLVGAVAGAMAETMIDDAIRARLRAEVAKTEASGKTPTTQRQ